MHTQSDEDCQRGGSRNPGDAPSNMNEANISTEGDMAAPTKGPKNPAHFSCHRSESALSPRQS